MNNKYPLSYILVDDDEDDRLLIKLAFQNAQKQLPIYEFTNGQQLLDFLTYNSAIREDDDVHWLVVMDINMPILDGLSAVQQIRQRPNWQNIPVLIMSTADDPQTIERAKASGATDYIVKPTSINQYTAIFDQFFVPWLTDQ
ncbi:response regulator [Spirosoma gilvum]